MTMYKEIKTQKLLESKMTMYKEIKTSKNEYLDFEI